MLYYICVSYNPPGGCAQLKKIFCVYTLQNTIVQRGRNMSEKTIRKSKIGARCLSKEEAELILPTYGQIYKQIEQFRRERRFASRQEGDGHDKDQKTNNIGIIGARGAGKSSILKTVRAELTNQKSEDGCKKDIILPIIVPENMSESSTLMATILGMLKDVVEERVKKQKREKIHPDCPGKDKLKREYEEVVKRYTFIQKEYRDILIREYTTENDYANSSTKVFNSDSEFINKFNQLIDSLVNEEEGKGLLFVFIDDIDLSTYRCGDVVKTLLSYLSNENIVTFISGDLETFEEALTLEFLRKEKVLNKDILNESMLPDTSGESTIIRRKMGLSYEYLKKIIPPVFRHNVKEWSLRERGKYCIFHSEENGKERNTLLELLLKALNGWVEPAYFQFMEYKKETTEGGNGEEKQAELLPFTFHLFDKTSRGLNNVYNVLDEIAEKRSSEGNHKDENNGEKERVSALNLKKQLLDTIVSSKQIFNQHRDDILKRMFNIGIDGESSQVFFDNANTIIYGEKAGEKEGKRAYYIQSPVERFSLFLLVDFAARLLYEKDYSDRVSKDEYYKKMKENAMEDLFFYPEISEKVMDVSAFRWEREEEKQGKKKESGQEEMTLYELNKSFLIKGKLETNLAYYYNLLPEKLWELYRSRKTDRKTVYVALGRHIMVAFWKGLCSVSCVNHIDIEKSLIDCYPVFEREFAYIRNQFSDSFTQNVAISLFAEECEEAVKDREYKYYSQRILANLIAFLLQDEKDSVKQELEDVSFGQAVTNEGEIIVKEGKPKYKKESEDIIRRIEILKSIDKQKLWKEEVMEYVIQYVTKEIENYLKGIEAEFDYKENVEEEIDIMEMEIDDYEWNLDIECAETGWDTFQKSYDGVSRTLSKDLKRDIINILCSGSSFNEKISFSGYKKAAELIETFTQKKAWYGKHEAQALLNDLQKAFPVIMFEDIRKRYSYLTLLLQCSYKYKMEMKQEGNIGEEAEILKMAMEKLQGAQAGADDQVLDQFIEKLNAGVEGNEKVSKDQFEALFS